MLMEPCFLMLHEGKKAGDWKKQRKKTCVPLESHSERNGRLSTLTNSHGRHFALTEAGSWRTEE